MIRAHFAHKYLIEPQHPLTVHLIGAGGTGSKVLTNLARLDATLTALEHPGLHVKIYDPDDVETTNVGRMIFSRSDVGQNKAVCLVTKINAFFGLDWEAVARKFPECKEEATNEDLANIFITCTDNISSRYRLEEFIKEVKSRNSNSYVDHHTMLYWCDFGNNQHTGQVVLGTIRDKIEQPKSSKYKTVPKLPCITDMSGYNNLIDDDSGPSCSHREALAKQDLFINSSLAELGSALLWKLIREGVIENHGLFLNLETLKVNPIPV